MVAYACSLVLVAIGGMGAVLIFGSGQSGPGVFNPPGLATGLGSVTDILVAPFARWDGLWYLWTALHGYGPGGSPPGEFFPMYPLIVAGVARLGVGVLLGGILVSSFATVVALRLTWKLTALEFGDRYPDAPRLAVFATAVFPMAFFMTAAYPVSLFLACSVGSMFMARQGRWAWAGLLGGLATAAHSLGFVLIVPLVLVYLKDRRWRFRLDILWLVLVPAGLGAFMAWLALKGLDPLSPFTSQRTWLRENSNPFHGVWLAGQAAWAGARQIVSRQSLTVYWTPGISFGYDPMTIARDNLEDFAFFLIALGGAIAAFRRLPVAYGAYVIAVLVVVCSDPIAAMPLSGLPRFVQVAFPLMMMIGLWLARHRRWRLPVLGTSALLLVYFSGSFATWHWVA